MQDQWVSRKVRGSVTVRVPKTSSVLVMRHLISEMRSPMQARALGPEAAVIYAAPCARMTHCAVPTRLPRRDQHARVNAAIPISDRAKDAEILALRHQIAVLERHLHGERVRFTWADRAWLAALLHRLPRDVLREIRLLVRLETVLRWHRDLLARRHAAASLPRQRGRPRTIRSIRA